MWGSRQAHSPPGLIRRSGLSPPASSSRSSIRIYVATSGRRCGRDRIIDETNASSGTEERG